MRVLANITDGELVGAHVPGVRACFTRMFRWLHGGQPALLDVSGGLKRFRGLAVQTGDDGHVLAERLEGLLVMSDMVKSVPVSFGHQR